MNHKIFERVFVYHRQSGYITHMKTLLIVLDSVGIGAAPDATDYGDVGSATLPHLAQADGSLSLPTLQSLGLGNIPGLLPDGIEIQGVLPATKPLASYGAMKEISEGKDTITGHWEMSGPVMNPGFHVFPPEFPSFPADLISEFERLTGRKALAQRAASGTVIIGELGEEAMKTGSYIVYTSADSVFQIAAHVGVIPLEQLYRDCEIARELCNPLKIGRVIARPFIGEPGSFTRTEDRKDYAFTPSEPFINERLKDAGIPFYAVGKIEDILAHRGITESNHTGNNVKSQKALETFYAKPGPGFIFANFIDFDMQYGHRRDPSGYARCLEQTDQWLAEFLPTMAADDLLLITADHGNDPTFKGSDHTREYVPLLAYQPSTSGKSLGIREGFYDLAQTLAIRYGLSPQPRGTALELD